MTLLVAWVDPAGRPRARVLRGETFVGRGPECGLALDDPSVTNIHAVLDGTRQPPVVSAVSPDAALFVNGGLVKSASLADGDTLRFGNVEARVLLAARYATLSPPLPARTAETRAVRAVREVPETAAKVPAGESAPGFPVVRVAVFTLLAFAAAGGVFAFRNVKWRDRLDSSYIKSETDLRDRLAKEIKDREKAEAAARASAARVAEGEKRALAATPSALARAETLQSALRPGAPAPAAAPPPAPGEGFLDRALNSVVAITGETAQEGSLGSGFFVTEEGFVVTNAHVVELRAEYRLHLRDGRVVAAEVHQRDRMQDLAVLRPKRSSSERLPVLVFGRARSLHIGDAVFAAGSPLAESLSFTVTRGIVSADMRSFGSVRLLQHDCAINPGNSGGPLLDAQGRVVGINTLKVTGAAGLGFAIPIEVAEELLRVWKVRG
ncbi:MAG: trypsin-like peptidase domain-containing protein [Acidobacteriota bacterium]